MIHLKKKKYVQLTNTNFTWYDTVEGLSLWVPSHVTLLIDSAARLGTWLCQFLHPKTQKSFRGNVWTDWF